MALVIALNKGRILKEVLPILEQCNVVLDEDPANSRKLVFDSVDKFQCKCLYIKFFYKQDDSIIRYYIKKRLPLCLLLKLS